MQVPISVCIIAKNEEKHIEKCLKYLRKYDFEIIVLDTGSTDKTYEIAKQYATKVETYIWEKDFSTARNKAASYASNDWILSIDCDEYLEAIDISELSVLMRQYPKCAGVIRLKNMINNDSHGYDEAYDDVIRFYNRKYYEYKGSIHEHLRFKEEKRKQHKMECFLMPMQVTHWGYAISKEEMRKKQERNLELLYLQLEERQEPYLYYQIGQSELVLEHYEKAANMFEKGLSFDIDVDEVFIQEMIISLAKAYVALKRMGEAIYLLERYEGKCHSAKFLYTFGNVYLDANEPLKALMKYVHATLQEDSGKLGSGLKRCYQKIIELYHQFGEDELAGVFVNKLNDLENVRKV